MRNVFLPHTAAATPAWAGDRRAGVEFTNKVDKSLTEGSGENEGKNFVFSDFFCEKSDHLFAERHPGAVSALLVAILLFMRSVVSLPAADPDRSADLAFLRDLTRDVVRASRVEPGRRVGGSPTNTVGFTLIMPGGRGSYPAFWIRDFAMSLESGFITPEEILNHLRLTARCQNGPNTRRLAHGLRIPPFAIPDHINFDGGAVFYPGTYSSGHDQGRGAYGVLPPMDDHYEFVHMGYCLFRATGKADFLREEVNGRRIIDRLAAAFEVPRADGETGLAVTGDADRAVGFGFCDAIYLTGKLLFPSLLRYRAAGELAELREALGDRDRVRQYRDIQQRIVRHLVPVFGDADRIGGWLRAATEVGRQPDVWGTLFALHLGALDGAAAGRAVQTVADAVRKKTIVFEAAVRHVPTDQDASPKSAWERTAGVTLNTYQNGAYWHTPTGWLIEAVRRRDPDLASRLFDRYVEHLRRNDFRLGPGHEAPWECLAPNGYAQNGVYMTSVTLPWSVLARSQQASAEDPAATSAGAGARSEAATGKGAVEAKVFNRAFRLAVTCGSAGVRAILEDRRSGMTAADGPYLFRAVREDTGGTRVFERLENASVTSVNGVLTLRGELAGLELEDTFAMSAGGPVMEERLVLRNRTGTTISLSDFEAGFQRRVTDRSGDVLPELRNDRWVAVPLRVRATDSQGAANDFAIADLLTTPGYEPTVDKDQHYIRVRSRHRRSEGWAWTHNDSTLGIFVFNQENMLFSVVSTNREPDGATLRFGGACMISGEPAALTRIAPGQTVDLGLVRYESMAGGYMEALYAFRRMLDERGCRFPADYDPPVHWEQLYDMSGAWEDRLHRYTKAALEKEAAKGRAYSCEALYLDPGWDTDFGTFLWGEDWLGPRRRFVREIEGKYGLKLSLHCPLATWMSHQVQLGNWRGRNMAESGKAPGAGHAGRRSGPPTRAGGAGRTA